MPKPIERIGDVVVQYNHLGFGLTPEVDAWLHARAEEDKLIGTMTQVEGRVPEILIDELSFWHGVANTMRPHAEERDPAYVASDDERSRELEARRLDKITSSTVNGYVISSIMDDTPSFKGTELVDITLAKIAANIEFLKTGDRKSFWPAHRQYAQEQIGCYFEARNYETLLFTARTLSETNIEDNGAEKLNEALASLGVLYADHELGGRAIALLSILDSNEHIDRLLSSVVSMMQKFKEEYGDEFYQGDFKYAMSILQGDTLERFKGLLEPASIPLLPNSKRIDVTKGVGKRLLEEWDESRPAVAVTSLGAKIELPFTDYRCRLITDIGEETESAMYDKRLAVDFTELDHDLQRRVLERLPGEFSDVRHTRELERLVLGFGFSLKTMDISRGDWRLMPNLHRPDITEEEYISGVVEEIEEAGEDWLITYYGGSRMNRECFNFDDVHAVAPKDANAFWFSGIPRQVLLPDNIRIGKYDVVLTPISFYRVLKVEHTM